ncbi:MAG: PAS domain-containing sensor histidine kinase [Halorientalis sp.]
MGGSEWERVVGCWVPGTHDDGIAAALTGSHERLCVEETTAAEARARVEEGEADCLIVGQNLSETTGVALARAARDADASIPVLLYPDGSDPAVASAALTVGITEYLPGGPEGVSPSTVGQRAVGAVETARRDAAFETSERRYETMLDTVGDFIYALDPDGLIEFVNDSTVRVTGYSREELVGEHVTTVIDEGDAADGRALIKRLLTDGRERGTVEMTMLTKDGERIPCENKIALMPAPDDAFAGTVGVMRDISERKRREQALEALHDATREMMTAERAEEVARVASKTVSDVLDMPLNGVFLYDADVDALAPVAMADEAEARIESDIRFDPGDSIAWRVFESGDRRVFSDVRESAEVYNPDTPIRSEFVLPLGDHGVLLIGSTEPDDFDESDVALAKVVAANLQTALTATNREQALRERESELERQNERLDEFASVVSHDLRNPLNVAQGRLEFYHETGEESHYQKAQQAHDRMGAIIDEVLALARQGRTVSDLEQVDLTTVVKTAWAHVETDDASLDIDGEYLIRADPSRLQQLLENLLRNAIEHGAGCPDSQSPDAAVEDDAGVSVRVGPLPDRDGFFLEDDGPGIPEGEREQVFESGFSTDDTGTGFGLAIVTGIAEAHGWDVTVTDAATGGARFEITGVETA